MDNSMAVVNVSISDIGVFRKERSCDHVLENITEPIVKLPKRIALSFAPPLSSGTPCVRQYLFTDFLGPLVSTLTLIFLLEIGFKYKRKSPYHFSPLNTAFAVLFYYTIVSLSIIVGSLCARVKLKVLNVLTLIGYSFYGFIVSLFIPFVLRTVPDYVFYACAILFAGSSCFRVQLILFYAVETPIARFLICSFAGNVHMLFVIYLYYHYINPTYQLNNNSN